MIMHGKPSRDQCLDLVGKKVVVSKCDNRKKTQRWDWGYVNRENLDNWEEYGAKLLP